MKSFCLPFFSTFAETRPVTLVLDCTALKKYSISASAENSYGAGLKKF